MSVVFQQTVNPWGAAQSGSTPVPSGSFTPTANNALVVIGMDKASGTSPVTFSSSAGGTFNVLSPPGAYNDTFGETVNLGICLACLGGAQTVGVLGSAGDGIGGMAWEYSGVGSASSVSGVTINSPGTGSGAITGTSVIVPTGAILLAIAIDLLGSSGLNSPSGTNRGSGTFASTKFITATEYSGTGASIQPTFTTTHGTDLFVVMQFLLTVGGGGSLGLMGVGV